MTLNTIWIITITFGSLFLICSAMYAVYIFGELKGYMKGVDDIKEIYDKYYEKLERIHENYRNQVEKLFNAEKEI